MQPGPAPAQPRAPRPAPPLTAARAGAALGAGCLGAVALVTAAATAVLATLTGGLFSSPPSSTARADIPPPMLTLYQQAAPSCPGLPWPVLAGIGEVETDHGRAPSLVSSAGAVGPMQFMPDTFPDYALPVPPGGAAPPTPWDPTDAVYAAARMLCRNGAPQDLHGALHAYNHSDSYVAEVLAQAADYAGRPALQPPSRPPTPAAATAIAFARTKLGTPYEWGGTGDPGHGYDCSGLVQAAYAAAGVPLPRVAQDQYDDTPHLPAVDPPLPGDLVFYGPSVHDATHVGLYLGAGQMIDAPHTGAVVRVEPFRRPHDHYLGATRPAPPGAP
ncbi:NlpC/P60 family protein [Kitasatospora viridis]|uniref:Transglycosylase-like protein with SLT domain n=1 Tax=Kitasatospora viridis TaxID=281105 RepID=A0A561TW65_9ACTN|nr:bifunctional lytic transglycosylase/C40 family peptidase [Kitasatospora viridis]TWF91334.1 transglycosylase-like protein with SLT domain [Kitasatospora viridis]